MSEVTDDFLQHYGVQGMKWGKRNGSSKSGGGGTGKNGKVTSGDIHLARRAQVARARNLSAAESKYYAATTNKGRAKAEKMMDKLEKDFYNNPDAKISAKMTKSEKVGAAIVYGMAGAMVVSYAAAIAASNRNF